MEYTVDEVIEALRAEGFSDEEFLRYAVPLLGYESKSLETNIPFTQDVIDKESPSVGIFQINVDTAAPQIFQYMARIGDEGVSILPRDSEHKRALATGDLTLEQKGRWDLLKVEGDAKDYAITFIQGLDLNQQAELFRIVYDRKEKEQEDKSFKNVLKKLYPFTTGRMYEYNDDDAIAFLNNIIKDVDNYLAQPPVEVEEPTTTPNYAGRNYEEDEGNTDLPVDTFKFLGTEMIPPEATKEVWAKALQRIYGVTPPTPISIEKGKYVERLENKNESRPSIFTNLRNMITENIDDVLDRQQQFNREVYGRK